MAIVDLPAPVAPTRATSPREGIVRSSSRMAGSVRPGYVTVTPASRIGASAGTGLVTGRGPARRHRHRLVEDREQPGRHGPARRTAVVARRQLAERQEELGDDDQDRQRALELDRAGHQPEADLDRDEGDRDGATPLEHERGLERGPQHLQRRVAVLAADRPDGTDLLGAPAECLERRDPAQHVEEERAEPADLREPPFGDRPRPAADEPEQQDEDRAGEQEDERRRRIDDEDRTEDEQRDCDGERARRLERGEVGVDVVEPVGHDRDQLAAFARARSTPARGRGGGP